MLHTVFNRRAAAVLAVASLLAASPLSAQEGSVSELAARIARLERTLESRGLVDLLGQVEALEREVQRLQGEIETQAYTIDQLRKQQRDIYADLDSRLDQRGGAAAVTPAMTVGPTGPPGAPAEPPLEELPAAAAAVVAGTPVTDDALSMEAAPAAVTGGGAAAVLPGDLEPALAEPAVGADNTVAAASPITLNPEAEAAPTVDSPESEAAYREAFALLKAGKYAEAIAAYRLFIEQYPSSQYADNAQYWLGESFYVMRQFDPAIAEYQQLVQTFPASPKRSHAMLKIGYSYHELGQADLARAILEDLKANFPGTTAAQLAEQRIQRIRLQAGQLQ
ncbi:MAG: tol-pal system protein YbgF [Gammaproteobacteria bacterium]|nr:tol-pal system protein YbgF [Gammaproteobacteria bacterium]